MDQAAGGGSWGWALGSLSFLRPAPSNAKYMPADVAEALISIFKEEGQLSNTDADAYLARLQQTLRFQTETWA